jgi:hypothetical protein
MPSDRRVPLGVLDTAVDVVVRGPEDVAQTLEGMVRAAWHLALREPVRERGAVEIEVELLPEGPSGPASPAYDRAATQVRDADPARLMMRLTHAVTSAAITAQTGTLLMLHAAGLAHRDTGAASVWVAPGNTGKSTLCRTLGPHYSYLSDETVGIRRDGTVAPYAKPVSVRVPGTMVKQERAPGDCGLGLPGGPARVAGVVLLHRDAAHQGGPEVTPLATLDAVQAITPESSAFMATDRPLTWLAGLLESTGGARQVTYAEVQELRPLAVEIMGEP